MPQPERKQSEPEAEGLRPSREPLSRRKPRRWLRIILICAIAAGGIGYGAMQYAIRSGNAFFETGKRMLESLQAVARSAKAGDMAAMQSKFASDFQGSRLGLTAMQPIEERDGIHRLRFSGGSEAIGRDQAIEEWKTYLGGFSSIESVVLAIDRMEEWGSPERLVATVRFEAIGTPRGTTRNAIDRATFRFGFRDSAGGPIITSAALVGGDRYYGDKPHFSDVSRAAGVDFLNRYYPAFLDQPLKFGMIRYGPGGITAVDYDNDGLYDLFIPDGVESKLFRNTGDGRFQDVTTKAGLAGLDGVSVAVFADYDNDGHKDIFVSRTFKHNQIFHGNGDGTFTDVTAKSGIGDDCCTTVASWADYDNDGHLDLYVGRYLDPRTKIPTTFYARNGEFHQLYRNNGNGTFENVTIKAGIRETGLCLGSVFGDYDDDGYPDLYVVNDFGRKTLFHNNRDGTFTDVTVATGTLAYGAGMSASMADYDNDGRLDIYSTNIRSDEGWFAAPATVARYMVTCWRQGVWKSDMPLYYQVFRQSGTDFVGVFEQMASGNILLHNEGDGTFKDTTKATNANPVGWYWGASFADFDNDGWQDIYAADGWVYNDRDTEIELEFLNNVVSNQDVYKTGIFFDPKHFGRRSWHGWERNRHLRNRGDGTFEEIATPLGNDLLTNSRGVAVADFWNRGVLDIAVAASTDRHALLKNEVGAARHWLEVELVGTKSNRDAVGARVTARVKGKQQIREVVLGDGYGSQNTLRQHFGLSDANTVDELIVKWPRSGIVQKFQNVASDRIIEITEGSDKVVEKQYRQVRK
jgi:hypothetical protein